MDRDIVPNESIANVTAIVSRSSYVYVDVATVAHYLSLKCLAKVFFAHFTFGTLFFSPARAQVFLMKWTKLLFWKESK